jgi:hypothetical protein
MSASTIQANLNLALSVVETFTDAFVTSDNTLTLAAPATNVTLNAGSTPPASKYTGYEVNLSGGALTLDLTNLLGRAGDAFTGTGLKLQAVVFANKSTNANTMLIATGGSNGYQTDNATNLSLPLAPGQAAYLWLDNASQTVGSSHKTFDITGTGSQTLQIFFVFG